MQFAITDAGCEPNTAETTSGLVTFEVENKGAAGVTELEVIKDKRILGEVENLADGLNGTVLAHAAARRLRAAIAPTGQRRSAARSP